jgi:hypothetical protein
MAMLPVPYREIRTSDRSFPVQALTTAASDLSQRESLAAGEPEGLLDLHQLRERGWTRQMVTRFLGAPDSMRRPTTRQGGRPAALYFATRVWNAERLLDFVCARRDAPARSAAARGSQQARREAVLSFAKTLDLSLPNRSLSMVQAIAENTHADAPVSPAQQRTADRIVAWLLDEFKADNAKLTIFARHPGIEEARALLRQRQLRLIASQYPELSAAVQRSTHGDDPCPHQNP